MSRDVRLVALLVQAACFVFQSLVVWAHFREWRLKRASKNPAVAGPEPTPEHVGGYRTAAPVDAVVPEEILWSRGWRVGEAWIESRDGVLWANSRWRHHDATTPADPDAVIREVSLRGSAPQRPGRDIRLGPICAHVGDGIAWARLWERGPGVAVKDTGRRRLLFSERNGRGVRVGRWLVKRLRWERAR
jgi:hypothetical protein